MNKWNPRYVAFAKANGRTPETQNAIDEAGTHKLEFILWIGRKWQEFAEAHGCKVSYWLRIWDHNEFDLWLGSRSETNGKVGERQMNDTKRETSEWPRLRVEYVGGKPSEILTVQQAAERFGMDEGEFDWLGGHTAGTSINHAKRNNGDVYMIHRYTEADSIRDAAHDLLNALEGIMDHDLVPRDSVCGKMALAAIEKAKREGK